MREGDHTPLAKLLTNCRTGWLAQRESVHFVIIGFNRPGFDSAVGQEFGCAKQFTP